MPTDYPTALYAAAAALLGVIAEMLRGAMQAPGLTVAPDRYWTERRNRWTSVRPSGLRGRWLVDPANGAVAVAILPTLLALISLGPALASALFDPFQQLSAIWDGPVAALTDPGPASMDGTSVLAAVLLTVAAALAALGFGGKPAESVPVILPGLAITLLIAPIALDAAWPASTSAALIVFTVVDARPGAHPAADRHPGAAAAGHPRRGVRDRPDGRRRRPGRQPRRPRRSPCSRWAARSASAWSPRWPAAPPGPASWAGCSPPRWASSSCWPWRWSPV